MTKTYSDDPAFKTDGMPNGLTKREYFAAAALQGIATIPFEGAICDRAGYREEQAWMAVRIAEKLIEELNKEEK